MGTISYDGWAIEFDDRLLAHLHLVIVRLFRSQESFAMSWLDALHDGDGRSSIWLHPDGDIHFRFAGSRTPQIDPAWVQRLTDSARGSQGLIVTGENGDLARSTGTAHVARKH